MGDPTLLLTRPRVASERFAAACRDEIGRDIPVLISPVLDIRPIAVEVDPSEVGTFLFTSENGVTSLAGQSDLRGATALCVGDRTAEAAKAAGLTARSAGGDVEALLALVCQDRPAEPLVHIRGAHAAGDLAGRLSGAGIAVSEVVAYDQLPMALSPEARALLAGGQPVVLPLFSPRSAALLRDETGSGNQKLTIVAISHAVASAWGNAGAVVARHPDAVSMIREVRRFFPTTRLVAPRTGG